MQTKSPAEVVEITSILLIILVAIVIGFIWHSHPNQATTSNTSASSGARAAQYYTCFDQPSRHVDGGTNDCSSAGKTYAPPTVFSLAAVRGYAKLPYLATAYVINTSKQDFDTCLQNHTIAESRVYALQGNSFILFGLGGTCSTHSYQVLNNESGAWKPIATSASPTFACSALSQYKVPAALLTASGFTATCLQNDGTTIPYVTR